MGRQAHRIRRFCPCGMLLAIQKREELHLKYKAFSAVARGHVDVHCRRCGGVSSFTTDTGGNAAG